MYEVYGCGQTAEDRSGQYRYAGRLGNLYYHKQFYSGLLARAKWPSKRAGFACVAGSSRLSKGIDELPCALPAHIENFPRCQDDHYRFKSVLFVVMLGCAMNAARTGQANAFVVHTGVHQSQVMNAHMEGAHVQFSDDGHAEERYR